MPRFVAVDANATNRPVGEMADCTFVPLAGVAPSGVETSDVCPAQVLALKVHPRTKTSDRPPGLGAVASRFLAVEVKETNSPLVAIEGFALAPFAGVIPSEVEIRNVVGAQAPVVPVVVVVSPRQVSRTNTWGVIPSNVTFETRFVAVETNATNRPSGLIAGL